MADPIDTGIIQFFKSQKEEILNDENICKKKLSKIKLQNSKLIGKHFQDRGENICINAQVELTES